MLYTQVLLWGIIKHWSKEKWRNDQIIQLLFEGDGCSTAVSPEASTDNTDSGFLVSLSLCFISCTLVTTILTAPGQRLLSVTEANLSQQISDGLPWNVAQRFTVQTQWIIIPLVILRLPEMLKWDGQHDKHQYAGKHQQVSTMLAWWH